MYILQGIKGGYRGVYSTRYEGGGGIGVGLHGCIYYKVLQGEAICGSVMGPTGDTGVYKLQDIRGGNIGLSQGPNWRHRCVYTTWCWGGGGAI